MSNTLRSWRESLSRFTNTIAQNGRWLLRELRCSLGETYRFLRRAATLGRAYGLKLKLAVIRTHTELSLGRAALSSGLGDEGLRRELTGKAGKSGLKRIALLRRLAQNVKNGPATAQITAKQQLLRAHEAALENAEVIFRHERQGLFPNEPLVVRRAVTGVVLTGAVILLSLSMLRAKPADSVLLAAETNDSDPSQPTKPSALPSKDQRAEVAQPSRKINVAAPPPPRIQPPLDAGGLLSADSVVAGVTRSTSDDYLEAGFKEFRFGMSREEIQVIADRNKIPIGEGGQRFYFEDGGLIGYERLYSRDNAGYLAKFRELFGGALKENITEAVGTHQGSTSDYRGNSVATAARNESLVGRYYFPHSVAYLQATWGASAQFNSVVRQEHLVLNIFDRRWVDERLEFQVSQCRSVLEQVRQFTADEAAGALTLSALPSLLGAKRQYEPPKPDATVETVKLLNAKDEPFIVVERALKDLYERPKNTVSIGVHLPAKPGDANPLFNYGYLVLEMDRCHSSVAQEVFPPQGTTIQTSRMRDSHQTSFSWQTSSGWKISVAPGGHIFLANVPEKKL